MSKTKAKQRVVYQLSLRTESLIWRIEGRKITFSCNGREWCPAYAGIVELARHEAKGYSKYITSTKARVLFPRLFKSPNK